MEKEKVLIVDDSKSDLLILKNCLKDYNTFTALTSREAVSLTRKHKPSLVLIDYDLGSTSGIELLHTLQNISERAGFIIVTAHESVNIAVNALKNGAMDFVLKPFDSYLLNHIVRRALHITRENENIDVELSATIRNKLQIVQTVMENIENDKIPTRKLLMMAQDNLNQIIKTLENR